MTFIEMMASLVIARSQVERLEAALGVTAEEAATFLAVAAEARPSSMADLARRLDFPQSRASRLVRRLTQLGWVDLIPDGLDRRQFRVRLTGAGCEVLASVPANPATVPARKALTQGHDRTRLASWGTGVGHAASAGRGPAAGNAPGPVHLTG